MVGVVGVVVALVAALDCWYRSYCLFRIGKSFGLKIYNTQSSGAVATEVPPIVVWCDSWWLSLLGCGYFQVLFPRCGDF